MQNKQFDWMPTETHLRDSRIGRFMQKYGISSCQELIEKANTDLHWFWNAILEDLGFEWHTPYDKLLNDQLGMPWVKWFSGGKLNIVHHCLDRHAYGPKAQKTALIWEGEDGHIRKITYEELLCLTDKLASAMTRAKISRSDVVAMCMNLTIEAVAVMFASLKIGATCLQAGTWHAAAELANILQRGAPKMLFIHDRLRRGGEEISLREITKYIASSNETLGTIVALPRLGVEEPDIDSITETYDGRIQSLAHFLETASSDVHPKTLALDAEERSLILFSSGTTGRPKAIVHTHAGALVQTAKEIGYAFDCHENDVFCWTTSIGWMMAPWEIIGSMFFGATLVLLEGSHIHPTKHRLFEVIERHRVSIFGTTPGHLQKIRDGIETYSNHDISSLRILGSTGKVLDADLWYWFFKVFGNGKLPIINIFGGTEILGCLGSPLPIMPLRAGTVGMASLGSGADVCDEKDDSVRERIGNVVCRNPLPSMTKGFLDDSRGYLDTYFSNGPNLWRHGDRALIDEDGLWFHLGRADDLIIKDGIKHDPVKIEDALKLFPGPPHILDAAAVGVTDEENHDRIVCLVVLDTTSIEDGKIFQRDVRNHVKITYGPLGQPDDIYIVKELPLNPANKVPHKVLKSLCEGNSACNIALQNPSVIEDIKRVLSHYRQTRS
ncbi:MAG: AMP-binding protein [Candidatus Yanofskybacteria bacterium]|nr:AMP-binding protein [Candidatus Yanofskybacteria bacterium]